MKKLFPSIFFLGCMYKIIEKRFWLDICKEVLQGVIDVRQSAFMEWRYLLHSVLVANEVVEEAKRKKKKCMIFKVNYEKAQDSIKWKFVWYMLERLRFCTKWISWINGCITSSFISILVKGSPTMQFIPQRRLGQGDPLSPFLFTVVAKGLMGLMRDIIGNFFCAFEAEKNKVMVDFLQYADDTIFFGEATTSNVLVVKSIMKSFELAFGS